MGKQIITILQLQSSMFVDNLLDKISHFAFIYLHTTRVSTVYQKLKLAVVNGMLPLRIQRAKKVVSDSLGLVDFAIGLVNSVLNFPNGQEKNF